MQKPSGGWASVVPLCLQYIGGVNRLRGGGVYKWLIWMGEINVGCGQEDTVGFCLRNGVGSLGSWVAVMIGPNGFLYKLLRLA